MRKSKKRLSRPSARPRLIRFSRLDHSSLRPDRSPADRVFTQLVLDLQLARSVELTPKERLDGGVDPEQFERRAWSYLMDYLAEHRIPDDL
jgi:hypothetical protein